MTTNARWVVPGNHPAFEGHFPGNPMLPGAVLLDVLLETISNSSGVALDDCEVSSIKFLSPVMPGDELEIRHELTTSGAIRFDVVAGERKIATGSIMPGVTA